MFRNEPVVPQRQNTEEIQKYRRRFQRENTYHGLLHFGEVEMLYYAIFMRFLFK